MQEETKLARPPQLLPYVTPKKVGYDVVCAVGTSEPNPWPDPLPPRRPPRHLSTSAPRNLGTPAPSPVLPAKKVGNEVGHNPRLRQAATVLHPLAAASLVETKLARPPQIKEEETNLVEIKLQKTRLATPL